MTARVRQMVLAAGEQALGVPVRRVDIEVVDVFEDGPTMTGRDAAAARARLRHRGGPGGRAPGAAVPGVLALQADLTRTVLGIAGTWLGPDARPAPPAAPGPRARPCRWR